MTWDKGTRRLLLVGTLASLLHVSPEGALAQAPPRRSPTAVPTPIPTPVPPERQGIVRKGAAPAPTTQRYENPNIRFSRLTRVEEVDLDNDGVFEALVEGIGTVKALPPEIPAVGFL